MPKITRLTTQILYFIFIIIIFVSKMTPILLKKEKRLLKHSNIYHVPELFPSKNLFHTYLNWKKQGK